MPEKLKTPAKMQLSNDPLLLTSRERQILQMLSNGKITKQIAGDLGLSKRTVETHVRVIRRKIGASCQAHAVGIGIRKGLIA
jgi:DNA-binding NarL/FixJ family response regulator